MRIFFALIAMAVCALILIPLVTAGYHIAIQPKVLMLLWEHDVLLSLVNSLSTAFAAVCVAAPIALGLAWVLVRTNIVGRQLLRNLLIFPCFVPPFLLAVAWMSLAAPRVGLLNRIFSGLEVDIYSWWGLVWVYCAAYLPMIVASFCNALEQFDPSHEEAARICGAGPLRVLVQITVPLMVPVITSSSIMFVLAVLSAFGIPALIGVPARIGVLTTKIYEVVRLGGIDGVVHGFVLALWLLLLTGILLFLGERIQRNNRYSLVVGKVPRASTMNLGGARFPVSFVVAGLSFVLVLMPIAAMIISSFMAVAGDFSRFTMRNYSYLFGMPELSRAFLNSLVLCIVTGLLCAALGFALSYFRDRTELKGRKALFQLATLGYSLPGTLIALAVIVSYGTGWGIERIALYGSPIILVVAYASKYVALSAQFLFPAVSTIDHSLDDAARICGATWPRVLRQILLPLVAPHMRSILLLTSIPVFTELTMSALLVGPGTETVGTLLFQLQDYANPLSACALSTILILLLALLLPIIHRAQMKGPV